MEDKRNIIIATVLAALILFGWPYVTERFFPTPASPPARSAPATAEATPSATPVAGAPATRAVSVAQARTASPRIAIETPKLRGSINLTGARIDDLVLLGYRQSVERGAPPVQLFAPSGTTHAYFAGVGWSGAGLNAPTADTLWSAPAGAKLTPTTPVTLTHDNGVGQVFTITLSVDADYMFTARQSVSNNGAAPVAVKPYSFLTRARAPSPDVDSWTINTGAMGVFGGTATWFDQDEIDEAPGATLTNATRGGWLGFTDQFWLGAIIPDQAASVATSFRKGAGGLYQADFANTEAVLGAGQARTTTSRIFAGAKETALLDAYTDGGIPYLDRATDWGWFWFIAKPIFYLLDGIFGLLKNFGFAIMALTLLIRLVMFPIAQKQFASMAQMRVVQPKLKALQEKYADDKPRLQQEMMALYKTEKINPLAGCLPILVQIPIFYSLYKCLMLTVEMRHQPFILWIRDLSAPDPASLVTLGAQWGVSVPAFLGLGVLAVLLGVSMWAQFRLNPPAADPVQQQVFAIMPWMLMFIMAPFAAGLLLYWITNNVLTMSQQRLLYSRYPQMKQAMAVK
ncbi:MAG: membrane protein insertase YidC [Sphingopyxis sp.]